MTEEAAAPLTIDQAAGLLGQAQTGPAASRSGDPIATGSEEREAANAQDDSAEEITSDGSAGDDVADHSDADGREAEKAADADQALPQTYRLRVDDADIEVPADELVAAYRQRGEVEAAKKSAATQEIEAARARARLIATHERMEESLHTSDPDDQIDWDWLRSVDPGEYAARMADRQMRREQAQTVAEERERLQNEHGVAEARRLLDALPHWRDPAKAAEEGGRMKAYALNLGFSEEDLGRLRYDSRLVRVFRDAAVGKASASKADGPAKATAQTPARPAPSKAATPGSGDLAEYRQLSAKGSLTQDEAARLIMLGDKLPTDVWIKERNAQKSRQPGRR